MSQQSMGLYDPRFEHDNCGIGAVVNIKGLKSHETVANALKIVENLEHRAGKDAEGKTGDGVGILLQISHKFFSQAVKPLGVFLGEERDYGIGMFFFPQDELKRNQARKMFEIIVEKEGMEFLGWREVPTVPSDSRNQGAGEDAVHHAGLRRSVRRMWKRDWISIESSMWPAGPLSRPTTIPTWYPFPAEPLYTRACSWYISCVPSSRICRIEDYESAIAIVHSRFSTNTNPSWERAHPNRFIVHNGEINTIQRQRGQDAGPGGDHGVQLSERRSEQGASGGQRMPVPTPPCWITPWSSWL